MTHLSLFTGIGGLDIAAEWAGFETVGQCEWAEYPTKVLEKHWPHVARWKNICTLTKESFHERTGRRTIDVISGGFPCQPFSTAGKRRGSEDDRFLWPEMLRVIEELRPTWVVGENVAGIVSMALDDVLSDLEGAGYQTQAIIIPACGVEAPHKRDRVAILGYSKHDGLSSAKEPGRPTKTSDHEQEGAETTGEPSRAGRPMCYGDVVNTNLQQNKHGHNGHIFGRWENEAQQTGVGCSNVPHANGPDGQRPWSFAEKTRGAKLANVDLHTRGWWAVEPDVGRVAHGVPNRVDRLKCLGNAVVPQQFYPIFRAIHDIETM